MSPRAHPIPGAHPLQWQGHRWVLLPERALWWEARRTLIVADLHLGKEGFFQSKGLPVPEGTGLADLARLGALVGRLDAREVLILGDLVHGPGAWSPALVDALDQALPRGRTLVPGNHDPTHAPVPDGLGFELLKEGTRVEGMTLRHVPTPGIGSGHERLGVGDAAAGGMVASGAGAQGPELAGHLHPVYLLRGRGDALRLPCFVVGARQLILPAFGSFTGGFRVAPAVQTDLYLAVKEDGASAGFVSPLPGSATARRG